MLKKVKLSIIGDMDELAAASCARPVELGRRASHGGEQANVPVRDEGGRVIPVPPPGACVEARQAGRALDQGRHRLAGCFVIAAGSRSRRQWT